MIAAGLYTKRDSQSLSGFGLMMGLPEYLVNGRSGKRTEGVAGFDGGAASAAAGVPREIAAAAAAPLRKSERLTVCFSEGSRSRTLPLYRRCFCMIVPSFP